MAAAKEAKESEKRRAESIRDGFTIALKMLTQSGAPAVGHNSMFDLVGADATFSTTR